MRLSLARAAFFFLCVLIFVPTAARADDATSTVTSCTYEPFDIECTDVSPDAVPPDSLTPSEAQFLYDKDILFRDGKFIALAASLDGMPIEDDGTAPIQPDGTSTISWNYAEDPANPYHHILHQAASLTDVIGTANLTFDLYKGAVGASTLVYSKTLTGSSTEDIDFSFPDAGHYFITYSATYPHGSYPPGMNPADYCGGNGDICPVFHFSLGDFRTFVTTGVKNDTETGTGGDYIPAAFAILSFDVTAAPPPPRPEASNVLFLPGIEGSRLYAPEDGEEEKLWEPIISFVGLLSGQGDDKIRNLFLNATGKSVRDDIYTKESDILDTAVTTDYYKSFIENMAALKTAGTINDWKAVPYDWRLSLPDIIDSGNDMNGDISYTTATDTPYIEQTLRALAATSKTGKVTIIAHSNGGLVAKALMEKLGPAETTSLIDKVIFVGVPQSGAPEAIGALLYGYNQSIPSPIPLLSAVSATVARGLALNAPMSYQLLPSVQYFTDTAADGRHPVCVFTGSAYASEESSYGQVLMSESSLQQFLLASDEDDSPLNALLLTYGQNEHVTLDNWTPPSGVFVYQIAGWGADTVSGIDFYTAASPLGVFDTLLSYRSYRPIFAEDGDGVVPVPSALMMNAGMPDVRDYWLNLQNWNNAHPSLTPVTHGNILEAPPLETLISNIIEDDTDALPQYVSFTEPAESSFDKKLIFFLHSPLTLGLYDSDNHHIGLNLDGTVDENIPGASYGEFGEVKYLIAPEGPNYRLVMHGLASGTFSLDMEETTGGIASGATTIADVPTTASTTATLTIGNGISTASVLKVDENGNGTDVLSIFPEQDETVVYSAPISANSLPTIPDVPSIGSIGTITPIIPIFSRAIAASSTLKAPLPIPEIYATPAPIQKTAAELPKNISSSAIQRETKETTNVTYHESQTASAYEATSAESWFQKLVRLIRNVMSVFWHLGNKR